MKHLIALAAMALSMAEPSGAAETELKIARAGARPVNVKHWHGAAADSAMTHIAITEALDGKSAEWMEQVSEAQYGAATAPVAGMASAPASQGQQLFGDIAPKFAQLTDEVLFGEVWARPGLSDAELIEATTHLAFYAGWPSAVTAIGVAREVFTQPRP